MVLNSGLFVHKHASSWPLPYLLVSRAAVALLCVTAQSCLFSLPGSCLSWLWTSFKACPVSAPHQTHTHTHTGKDVYTLLLNGIYRPRNTHGTLVGWAKMRTHTHAHTLTVSSTVRPSFVARRWIGTKLRSEGSQSLFSLKN